MTDSISQEQAKAMLRWLNQNRQRILDLYKDQYIAYNEKGIADTIRFLNQFSSGYGNYTKERVAMFQDLTLDDILKEMDQELDKD
ncbi:MAG: hypothetical protein QNJ37_08435 [Crocosphaera sp.]|nr:hypothetical protein [Crocosphaera sp.]